MILYVMYGKFWTVYTLGNFIIVKCVIFYAILMCNHW